MHDIGADYRIDDVVGADVVHARGGRVMLVETVAGHSTTRLLKR
jgi:D-beta-D-heptose 7-phosphate kinase/D-beta-D-heptose 1-phosphate adenosyltransferase